MTPGKKKMLAVSVPFCALVVALGCAWFWGLRVNVTPSLPLGLYRVSDAVPDRGDLAAFCLPSSSSLWSDLARSRGYLGAGNCPDGLRPLLKIVAGVPGDHVALVDQVVTINGKSWPHGRIQSHDSLGRPVSSCLSSGVIPDGFALVLSNGHDGSFDSRYFGLMPVESLDSVKEVLMW